MTNLRELQRDLQLHVLHGTPAIVANVRQPGGLDAIGRLAIYANAHTLRLTEALRASYPALAHVMGTADFDAMSRAYIAVQPSHHASIRWFGAQLADHLHVRGDAVMTDIARWEWTLASVFDGPDADPVALDAVTAFAAADWPNLRIAFCGNLQRVAVRPEAVQAWRAATSGTDGSSVDMGDAAIEWLAWRRDLATAFRSLPPDEAWAFDAAARGATFGELCAGLALRVGEDLAPTHAASLLKRWLTDGCVTALTCELVAPAGSLAD